MYLVVFGERERRGRVASLKGLFLSFCFVQRGFVCRQRFTPKQPR